MNTDIGASPMGEIFSPGAYGIKEGGCVETIVDGLLKGYILRRCLK